MELLLKSEVWMANVDPCQMALAEGHNKNRWVEDSSSALHIGQELSVVMPIIFKASMVGRLSLRSFHTKVLIFRGTCTSTECSKLSPGPEHYEMYLPTPLATTHKQT